MKKRIWAAFISLCMVLMLLPVTALAATVENITYLDENGTQQTTASATQVTNSDTQWTKSKIRQQKGSFRKETAFFGVGIYENQV